MEFARKEKSYIEPIVTAAEMRYFDSQTIEKLGIPSLVLMERAALATSDVICGLERTCQRIAVFAGNGNNGGDGLAIARILSERGKDVAVFMPGLNGRYSKETEIQLGIIRQLSARIQLKCCADESAESAEQDFYKYDSESDATYDVVVDCLFGTGLARDITGEYAKAVEWIGKMRSLGACVVSVDIPSGISSDTGKILGTAVRADETVALQYRKVGHLLYPGREYAGKVTVKNIGIPSLFEKEMPGRFFAYSEKNVSEILPVRRLDGNKGTFGKVLLVAGSKGMAGAAILCARSIFKSGAGMVKILTSEDNRSIIQSTLPEAMLVTYGETPDEKQILDATAWADCIVAGCGISQSKPAYTVVKALLGEGQKKLVLDADALNLIAGNEELQELLKKYAKGKVILTPHPGELARLLSITVHEYEENPVEAVHTLSTRYACTVAGKNAVTLVASSEAEEVYVNTTGNDGMAVAGSGDVLSGVIGALYTQKSSFEAACAGVYLHGKAGDLAAEHIGKAPMMASDLADAIGTIFRNQQGTGFERKFTF